MRIPYKIIKSNRKTIAIQIKPNGEVVVRCPKRMGLEEINAFVEKKSDWIEQHLSKLKSTNSEKFTEQEIKALQEQAREVVTRRVQYYTPIIGVTYNRISIRAQHSRWGSCSSKGNLNFNCLLALVPEDVLDYVVVHELCHHLQHLGEGGAVVAQPGDGAAEEGENMLRIQIIPELAEVDLEDVHGADARADVVGMDGVGGDHEELMAPQLKMAAADDDLAAELVAQQYFDGFRIVQRNDVLRQKLLDTEGIGHFFGEKEVFFEAVRHGIVKIDAFQGSRPLSVRFGGDCALPIVYSRFRKKATSKNNIPSCAPGTVLR